MKTYIKRSFAILILLSSIIIASCERDAPDPGGTATQSMAGEWWIEIDALPGEFMHFYTYNTSSNSSSEMWFESADFGALWSTHRDANTGQLYGGGSLKTKVAIDVANLSFSGSGLSSTDPDFIDADENPITFTITNAKIIKGGTKGPVTGAKTDSIYFQAEFSDDPGTVYTFSGYARTRFSEDDH